MGALLCAEYAPWYLSGIYQVFIIQIDLPFCYTGFIETKRSIRKGNPMFYAIEYAYGRNVINNGNRGDRVLEFSAKQLRDAWVSVGSFDVNSAGARDILKARDSRVRGVQGLADGDNEGWRVMAQQRVDNSSALRKHYAILFYDWPEADHNKWVATAPEREIIAWARDTEAAAYEVEA